MNAKYLKFFFRYLPLWYCLARFVIELKTILLRFPALPIPNEPELPTNWVSSFLNIDFRRDDFGRNCEKYFHNSCNFRVTLKKKWKSGGLSKRMSGTQSLCAHRWPRSSLCQTLTCRFIWKRLYYCIFENNYLQNTRSENKEKNISASLTLLLVSSIPPWCGSWPWSRDTLTPYLPRKQLIRYQNLRPSHIFPYDIF